MRHYGKIVGGTLGLLFGHVPGLILGLAAGHFYDQIKALDALTPPQRPPSSEPILRGSFEQVAFTIGIVTLGAKMAKADGQVSRDEISAFKRVFNIPADQEASIGQLFDRARHDAEGFEQHAARLAAMFHDRPAVLAELLTGLMLVAAADGAGMHPAEEKFLRSTGRIFGFDTTAFNRLAAQSGIFTATTPAQGPAQDAAAVLGVPVDAGMEQIKAAYRQLAREHHPDRLLAAGMPPEFVAAATEKLKRINAAYDTLCRTRGVV